TEVSVVSINEQQVAVDFDSSGNFVVVSLDGISGAITAQRYNSSRVAQGAAISVGTAIEVDISLHVEDDGDFAVVWDTAGGINLQRYNANGTTNGSGIIIDSMGDLRTPSVDGDNTGNYVATYINNTTGAVSARSINSSGVIGARISVGTATALSPDIAVDNSGNYAVTFKDGSGIRVQRFNSSGVAQGSLILVGAGNDPRKPTIDMNATGDFAVTWVNNLDALVQARAYNSSGTALYSLLSPGSVTTDIVSHVSMEDDQKMVVVWENNFNFFVREYNSSGSAIGVVTQVNTAPGSDPSATIDARIQSQGSDFYIVTYTIGGTSYFQVFGVLASSNSAPTEISLSPTSINQSVTDINATVGTFSTIDADGGDTHAYTLISGAGDTNNASFNISGNTLRTTSALTAGNYDVRVNSNDGTDDYAEALSVTVVDNIAPVFDVTPSTSSITQVTFTLTTDVNEAGTIYYVIVADGATAPTSTEVKAGTGSGGADQVTSGHDTVSSGGFANNFSVTGLTAGTAYDVYVVAEDISANLQANPTKIDVTTNSIPVVAFTSTSSSGAESVSSADLEVSLSTISGSDVSVNYAVTGTATGSGTDYTLADGILTITAGDSNDNITIASIVSDAILEANETVIVTISSPTNATLGTNLVHTYTINNDDTATVTIANASGNENNGAITVTATLDNAVQGGFTVDVNTADGTATTADSDYSAVTSQTLTFAGSAGEMETFTVTPTIDTDLESNEQLTIFQNNLASTSLAIDITDGATITILNDDFQATVTTSDANSITSNMVDLGGEVTAEGSSSVTARGIVYAITSENATPQIGGANVITDDNGIGSGIFNETISSLAA
ncbi:beta strand repeat-containing protein, partial [Paraglaciecola sp.]|uniref:beta strand repeat-containing protein n=1 Tax=Paraglaciecola sp. TaxID=1920173 RepID=UPI003EF0990C